MSALDRTWASGQEGALKRRGGSAGSLAIDWRGHGESAPPADDFGADDLADDALAVIQASQADRVVPVAVAHAGCVAIELRRRLGARIPKLVLLDWIVLEAPPPFLAALRSLQDPAEWQPTRERLFSMWLQGLDIPALTHGVVLARAVRLQTCAARTLVFSLGTRNSFVVLPFALALPGSWDIAVVVIVPQSLVELWGMVACLCVVPRLLLRADG
ncbi:MAG TPA: alpha/beta fold hydrolase [Vicinamibacterales bacterium]|nr:alpha/beta fold hydrolase [Vicinamibacterales bacterium]